MDPRWKGKKRRRIIDEDSAEEDEVAAKGMGLDDAIIDLTSDAEDSSPLGTRSGSSPRRASSSGSSDPDTSTVRDDGEVKPEGAKGKDAEGKEAKGKDAKGKGIAREGGKRDRVKREGAKRAAADAMADRSGDVEVAPKPAEENVDFSRPTKRGKGPARDGGEEEDVEMVGRKGVDLPHNRFSCPVNPFTLADETTHKDRCNLCFCYVCDRPATDCSEWEDHCHASNSGTRKSLWENMRLRAKPRLRDGKSLPVSGLYSQKSTKSLTSGRLVFHCQKAAPAASSGGSSSSGAAPGSGEASSSSDPQEDKCNCEELCEPVHKVFGRRISYVASGHKKTTTVVVYLKGLTELQVLHAEQISVLATLKRVARESIPYNVLQGEASRRSKILEYEAYNTPHIHKVRVGNGLFDVMVAARDVQSRHLPAPWISKWTPGMESSAGGVRLGGADNLGFELDRCSFEERKAYFDHFITETPLPESVWLAVNDEGVTMMPNDSNFVRCLHAAHDDGWIDVEVRATYDPATNMGTFSLEVILLFKLLSRGASMCEKSKTDFAPIVTRLLFLKGHSPGIVPSTYLSRTKLLRRRKRSGSLLPSSSSSPPSTTTGGFLQNGVAAAGRASGATAASGVPSAEGSSTAEVASAGKVGRMFTASSEGHGGRASLDVTLPGLLDSLRNGSRDRSKWHDFVDTPAKLLVELENLQHNALAEQPPCLSVELYEHQLQDAQWMLDQETLDGGSMQHLWAELPPHPLAPANGERKGEFRTCWFSPVLNQFTVKNPFRSGMKGGILCDEMGLGKTAATLALHLVNPPKTPSEGFPLDEKEWGTISGLQAMDLVCAKSIKSSKEAPGSVVSKGTLVVCKVSIVGQWVEEAKRLCGGALRIYPYHGSTRKKDPNFLSQFDLVVTTYGVVQADASRNSGFPPLRRIRWWRVVLDESHTIAHTTKAARVVKQLIANRRWCMTGTPYISRFSDVNGQLGFIGLEGAFSNRNLGDLRPNNATAGKTLALLRRVILRHSQGMKLGGSSILGLQSITHEVEELTLPPQERKAYLGFEKAVQKDYIAVRHRLRHKRGSHTMEVLTLLSKFRQACSGGQLLIDQSAESGEGGEGRSATASCVDAFCLMCGDLLEAPVRTPCGHVFCQVCITSALAEADDEELPCPKCKKTVGPHDLTPVGRGGGSSSSSSRAGGSTRSRFGAKLEPEDGSGIEQQSQGVGSGANSPPGVVMETKLKALVGRLSAIHAEDPTSKSLVFSQFSSSLEWLKHALPKHGFEFRTLAGNMSRKQRTDALKAFANDPPTTVFLLSVRSGAVGINLTQANNVFFLEPLLNLALEKQAVGRVSRLGQSRPVTVTKLVLKESIETRILALQKSAANTGPTPSSSSEVSSSSGVAGNISKDDAKNLKIEEYNALFGLMEDQPKAPKAQKGDSILKR